MIAIEINQNSFLFVLKNLLKQIAVFLHPVALQIFAWMVGRFLKKLRIQLKKWIIYWIEWQLASRDNPLDMCQDLLKWRSATIHGRTYLRVNQRDSSFIFFSFSFSLDCATSATRLCINVYTSKYPCNEIGTSRVDWRKRVVERHHDDNRFCLNYREYTYIKIRTLCILYLMLMLSLPHIGTGTSSFLANTSFHPFTITLHRVSVSHPHFSYSYYFYTFGAIQILHGFFLNLTFRAFFSIVSLFYFIIQILHSYLLKF